MSYEGKQTRAPSSARKSSNEPITYLQLRCNRNQCTNPSVMFRDKTGYVNPYNHLLSCYGIGSNKKQREEQLLKMYHNANKQSSQTGGNASLSFPILFFDGI